MMIPASWEITFSIIRWDLVATPFKTRLQNSASKFVLSESVAGQGHSLVHFLNFDANGLRLRRADAGGTQHGVLRKQLTVDLCYQKVGAARVVSPNLARLHRLDHVGRLLIGSNNRQSGNLPLNKS